MLYPLVCLLEEFIQKKPMALNVYCWLLLPYTKKSKGLNVILLGVQ